MSTAEKRANRNIVMAGVEVASDHEKEVSFFSFLRVRLSTPIYGKADGLSYMHALSHSARNRPPKRGSTKEWKRFLSRLFLSDFFMVAMVSY